MLEIKKYIFMDRSGSNHMEHIRTYLKDNLLNNKTLVGYEKEWKQILELVERTIVFGESNSALVIGPRGCGKTTLINDVFSIIQSNKKISEDFILVKLHGLIHTDDRLALSAVTIQMNLENVTDGKIFGSFAENLAFLLSCLRTGDKKTSKSVIFILEEFDLFCAHHNQTLLYNLFDVSQSAQTPICVIGITCRLDVTELLEKRVKSRFSHRQYFLFPGQPVENTSVLDYFLNTIERYLKLPEKWNLVEKKVKKQWNSKLNLLLENKKFKSIVQRLVDIDSTETTLRNVLLNILFQLRNESDLIIDHFQEQLDLVEKDDSIQVLQDLNALELCLIIAMKHHIEIYDNQPMNFEMVFSRYIKFASSNANVQTIHRPVILKAFEHIQKLELISMLHSSTMRTQKEYQFFKLLVTSQQISEAIKKYQGLPTEVAQWANSSLA